MKPSAPDDHSHAATLALARELIACRSLTPDDAGSLALIAARLAPLGFDCERIDRGGVANLWARRGDASPLVCLAGHVDVVPPGPSISGPAIRSRQPSATATSSAAAPRT